MTIEGAIDTQVDTEIVMGIDIDPVCENPVDPDEACQHELAIEFADREYLFCSSACKREFVRRPTAYAIAGRSEP